VNAQFDVHNTLKASFASNKQQDGVQYLDPDSPAARAELAKMFADAGWTPENSPQLYKELHTPQKLVAQPRFAQQSAAISTQSNKELESLFSHLGFNIVKEGTTKLFKVRLLNSEPKSTKMTVMTISLVNEKGEQITTKQTSRFFGDASTSASRKVLGGEASLQSAYDYVKKAKAIYGEGTAYVLFKDGTKVLKKGRVKYDRNAILGMLSKELGIPMSNKYSKYHIGPVKPIKPIYPDPIYTDPIYPKLPEIRELKHVDQGAFQAINGVGGDFFEHVVNHPKDWKRADASNNNVSGQDGKIMVCLNRDYGDCDYPMVQSGGDYNNIPHVTIPFQGQITLPTYISKVLFKEDGELDVNNVPPTDVMIQGKDSFIDKLSYHTNHVKNSFSQYFTIEYSFDPNMYMPTSVLRWNIPRDKGIFAKPGIFERRQDAYWILNIAIEENWMGSPEDAELYLGISDADYKSETGYSAYIIASEDAPNLESGGSVYNQAPLQFSYSCLAEGSLILMADGTSVAIETLNIGDLVTGASEFSPKTKETLRIADISVGVEHLPMIQLTTDEGQVLTLTESHPVLREGGQPVWALNVKEGDKIQVNGGLATVTGYEKVDYKDNVYNLKLERANGDSEQGESFVMFANGISVGDLAMQSENEFDTHKESVEDVLKRLPVEWHTDYLNSLNTDK
jgi:hypothetical protein